MLHFLERINKNIDHYLSTFKWSNTYGIARSFIALSLFLTLSFSDVHKMISPLGKLADIYSASGLSKISIFYLFRDNLILAKIISLVVLATVIIGWRPRFTGVLHWWIAFSFTTSSTVLEGGDQLGEIISLLLIPVTLFDHRKFHWQNDVPFVHKRSLISDSLLLLVISCFIMISLQVSYLYFNASTGKFSSEEWANGTAVYYWIDNSIFGASDGFWKPIFLSILKYPVGVMMFTWGAIVIEIILFTGIMITNQKVKRALLFMGIILHLMFGLAFGLWSFYLTMIGALFIYLGPRNTGVDKAYLLWKN
jgi:antimicrobial peptide system SdpB family protein